jgi:hypothetical protein
MVVTANITKQYEYQKIATLTVLDFHLPAPSTAPWQAGSASAACGSTTVRLGYQHG